MENKIEVKTNKQGMGKLSKGLAGLVLGAGLLLSNGCEKENKYQGRIRGDYCTMSVSQGAGIGDGRSIFYGGVNGDYFLLTLRKNDGRRKGYSTYQLSFPVSSKSIRIGGELYSVISVSPESLCLKEPRKRKR